MPLRYKDLLPFLLLVFWLPRSAAQTNTPTTATGPASTTARKLPTTYTTSPTEYIRVFTPQMPVTDSSLVNMSAMPENIQVSTGYKDLYGRIIQNVVKQASPARNDLVAPVLYDELGRNAVSYLPFTSQPTSTDTGRFKRNPYYLDSVFYKTMFPNEQINYGVTQYDNSPFNLPIKTMAPGNSWTGANVGISYTHRTNTGSDSVRLWTINISSEDDVPVTSTIYAVGTLTVQQVTDEKGTKSIAYMDELGRTVLVKTQLAASPTTGHAGWLCTYYVYDEMGHLRVVIPPKAVEALNNATANWNLGTNPTINTNLCYAYWYDNLGNLLMKRVPGKGKLYSAYDALNRLVLTQNPNLRANSEWAFIKYDGQSRAIKGGKITMSGLTAAQVQVAAADSSDYPTLSGTYTIMSETYYDDYNWVNGNTTDSNLINGNINSANFITNYNTGPEYAQPVIQSKRIRGKITGTKTLVLTTNTYLYTSNIYDNNGRLIQTKKSNYTGGRDITTVQYSFSGRVLRQHIQHQKLGSNTQIHTVLTKLTYDHAGRLKSVTKNIDGTGDRLTVQNAYNELGQISSKTLGNTLETQAFSYNIRGWLTGINKGYAETANSTNYFGEALFYDYGFTNTQLNGNIAGIKWRNTGDDIQRAYGFSYDNTNRLTKADFTQRNRGVTAWTNDKMDFSVSGLTYDANGNISAMKQRGVDINKPVTIDSLTYSYLPNSNQLQKIKDGIAAMNPWGDFKDTSSIADDYVYDGNGNITIDMNKHIHTSIGGQGIGYNVLDKPITTTVNGKGTIAYLYDATGNMIQKTVTDTRTGTKKVMTYVAGFVYQKMLPQAGNAATVPDTLQYALHEEGRMRWVWNKSKYAYDYFLKDHQGNVRSVITDTKDTASYIATMESADSVTVSQLFYNVYDPVKTVGAKPPGFDTNTGNQSVAKLNGSTAVNKPNGPAIMLKVMAGDNISVSTYGFFNTAVQPSQNVDFLTPLLQAMTGGVIGGSGGKMLVTQQTAVNNTLAANVPAFFNNTRSYDNTKPKAYLNWILLDEQLNYLNTGSGAIQLTQSGAKQPLSSGIKTISESGYLYVYVSNESAMDVYFDDLSIVHYKGALLSEEGYYPFGLTMRALSSQAGAVITNSYKYNSGTELTEDLDVDYYETYMRQYDAQIGRFTGVDVLSEATFGLSPYNYGANDPIYFNDPSGLSFGIADGDYTDLWNAAISNLGAHAGLGIPAYGGDAPGYGGIGGIFGGGGGFGRGGGGTRSKSYNYHYRQYGDGTDYDKKPHPGLESPDMKSYYDKRGAKQAYKNFTLAYTLGSAYGGDFQLMVEAAILLNNFTYGHKGSIDLTGGAIARHVFNSPEFKEATQAFENEARQSYEDNNNSLATFDGDDALTNNHIKYFWPWNDLALTTVIGGYKSFHATVTVNNGKLSFSYTIFDVFGAGADDSSKWYFPGLEALYYLQHYAQVAGKTFMPFIWSFTVPSPN